ncbi:hypothetical protein BC829DRAFT_389860 [Chytridium lagenaria]|nr:hypothetical protein BC829DRAFT_389860 [Chytridium lagenaria]
MSSAQSRIASARGNDTNTQLSTFSISVFGATFQLSLSDPIPIADTTPQQYRSALWLSNPEGNKEYNRGLLKKALWTLFFLVVLAIPITTLIVISKNRFFTTTYNEYLGTYPKSMQSGMWYQSVDFASTGDINSGDIAIFNHYPSNHIEKAFEQSLEVASTYSGSASMSLEPKGKVLDMEFDMENVPEYSLFLSARGTSWRSPSVTVNITKELERSQTNMFQLPLKGFSRDSMNLDFYAMHNETGNGNGRGPYQELNWIIKINGTRNELDTALASSICYSTSRRCFHDLPYFRTSYMVRLNSAAYSYNNVLFKYTFRYAHVIPIFVLLAILGVFALIGLVSVWCYGKSPLEWG